MPSKKSLSKLCINLQCDQILLCEWMSLKYQNSWCFFFYPKANKQRIKNTKLIIFKFICDSPELNRSMRVYLSSIK